MTLELSPFQPAHAKEIARWITSAVEARAWAGESAPFPVTAEQICKWHAADADLYPFVAQQRDSGLVVASGEMWVDRAAGEIELARIVVRPGERGTGVGREFVKLLVAHAQATFALSEIFLRVVPENLAALSCYAAAGFTPMPPAEQEEFNEYQPRNYIWLRYRPV